MAIELKKGGKIIYLCPFFYSIQGNTQLHDIVLKNQHKSKYFFLLLLKYTFFRMLLVFVPFHNF